MADIDAHSMEKAVNLTGRLRAALTEVRDTAFDSAGEPQQAGVWQPLPDRFSFKDIPAVRLTSEITYALDRVLIEKGGGIAPTARYRLPPGQFWSLGSLTFTYPVRAISRGFVEPVLRVPIIWRVPASVVAFLLGIPGDRDLLEREHHNQVGWHYHYLDFKKARSNIVLCWDTGLLYHEKMEHPLFQERHGEGHADFTARPDRWGPTKKKSMHGACSPDLKTRQLADFRCASSKAGPVWPLSASLTSISSAAPHVQKFPSKKTKKVRR